LEVSILALQLGGGVAAMRQKFDANYSPDIALRCTYLVMNKHARPQSPKIIALGGDHEHSVCTHLVQQACDRPLLVFLVDMATRAALP
jgi:hypothetical protein